MGRAWTKIDPVTQVLPFKADGAITKNRIVVLSTIGKVKMPTGANVLGEVVIGVALETVADGEHVSVAVEGAIVPIDMAATVAIGDSIVVNGSTGKGSPASQLTTTPGTECVGYALEIGANNERSAVLVQHHTMRNGVTLLMTADGAVAATDIVIVGAANRDAKTAGADPTTGVIGVAVDTAADNASVRVVVSGPALITAAASGSVDRGDPITSAASGRAKAAAPAAGVNSNIVGRAIDSVADAATGLILVAPGMMQGA